MAFTRTFSKTKTFTRIEFLKNNLRVALRRTKAVSSDYVDTLMKGVDNFWIEKFLIYGFDSKNFCRAEFSLEIKWDEYNNQIAIGKPTITVEGELIDGPLIEIDEAINTFNTFIKEYSLRPEFRIRLSSQVYNNPDLKNKVYKELNLSEGEPIQWSKEFTDKYQKIYKNIPETPELRVGIIVCG